MNETHDHSGKRQNAEEKGQLPSSGERSQHLFLIRLWHEGGAGGGQWRGHIKHLNSERHLFFAALLDMNDFIQWQID